MLSFEHECYNACANRAYFSVFQAAIAVLLHKGMKRGKYDHRWVQSEFNEKLIKRHKIYPGRIKPYLMEMQMLRNTADYENDTVSKKDAADQLRKAKEIIGLIEKEIGQ
ncbi:MAG: HEPN domain-containing protein [Desulfobacteraceae bacterium]|nr:HEPN domain-containing protein [Desulfobacteraceae bacterium]